MEASITLGSSYLGDHAMLEDEHYNLYATSKITAVKKTKDDSGCLFCVLFKQWISDYISRTFNLLFSKVAYSENIIFNQQADLNAWKKAVNAKLDLMLSTHSSMRI